MWSGRHAMAREDGRGDVENAAALQRSALAIWAARQQETRVRVGARPRVGRGQRHGADPGEATSPVAASGAHTTTRSGK